MNSSRSLLDTDVLCPYFLEIVIVVVECTTAHSPSLGWSHHPWWYREEAWRRALLHTNIQSFSMMARTGATVVRVTEYSQQRNLVSISAILVSISPSGHITVTWRRLLAVTCVHNTWRLRLTTTVAGDVILWSTDCIINVPPPLSPYPLICCQQYTRSWWCSMQTVVAVVVLHPSTNRRIVIPLLSFLVFLVQKHVAVSYSFARITSIDSLSFYKNNNAVKSETRL